MKVHVLMVLGRVSGYRAPDEGWLIEADLVKRLSGESPKDVSKVRVEGKPVDVVRGSPRELGTIALLESVHEGSDVEPGRVIVVSTDEILKGEREGFEDRVRGPLEELGYEVEERAVPLTDPYGLLSEVHGAVLGFLDEVMEGEARLLLDVTHGARVMPFTASLGCLSALRLAAARNAVLSAAEGEEGTGARLLEGVAASYSLAGPDVKGVVEGDRWVVMDATPHLLAWRSVDVLAEFLRDPSPVSVDELERIVGEDLEALRTLAKLERMPVPGLVADFLRDNEPPRLERVPGHAVKTVWETLGEVFTSAPIEGDGDALGLAVSVLNAVREPLGRYCRYLLDRGRVAEAASLMNEVHLLARAVAVLAQALSGRRGGEVPEAEVARLLEAVCEELRCKVLEPEGLEAARRRELEALHALAEASGDEDLRDLVRWRKGEAGEAVWRGSEDVGRLSGALETGLPFKRSLGNALKGALEDRRIRELLDAVGREEDDPARFLEDPPIRRVRNKLQHADPVVERPEEHEDLAELCRAHLERITLPLLDALAEAIEGLRRRRERGR